MFKKQCRFYLGLFKIRILLKFSIIREKLSHKICGSGKISLIRADPDPKPQQNLVDCFSFFPFSVEELQSQPGAAWFECKMPFSMRKIEKERERERKRECIPVISKLMQKKFACAEYCNTLHTHNTQNYTLAAEYSKHLLEHVFKYDNSK